MTDVIRERIPLLWSTVRERVSTNGFCLNMGNTKYPGFCRRTKLSGRGVHSEKARELSKKHMTEHTVIHLAESTHTNTLKQTKLYCMYRKISPLTKRNNKKGGFHGLQKGWIQ